MNIHRSQSAGPSARVLAPLLRIATVCMVIAWSGEVLAQSDTLYGNGAGATLGSSCSNQDSAFGYDALYSAPCSATEDTAVGSLALYSNQTAHDNTAVGYQALYTDDQDATGHGNNNTAVGAYALYSNVDGGANTAVGLGTLYTSTVGKGNTAIGTGALEANNGSTGYNTAVGYEALGTDPSGNYSTAVGAYALAAVTSASIGYNTGFGAYTLNLNSSGSNNTAFGYAALRSTSTGNNNIGFGYQTLYQDGPGSNNIAMGYQAAYNLQSGSNTIEIGNAGAAADTDLIRIGTQGVQKSAFVAGIYGNTLTGSAVYVTSSGELGVQASSERFKTDIEPMGAASERLAQLRPVTFKLKSDPGGTRQYGLIAEEVAKVYPELVIRGADGRIDGIRYEELTPMLLNQVQHQQAQIQELRAKLIAKDETDAALRTELAELKQTVMQALSNSRSHDALVAHADAH